MLKKIKAASVGTSQNLIVHGDNLEALKALMPYYVGKVKCIYIDPPYNTGNEGWVYNDKVNSPKIKQWLEKTVKLDDLTRHDKWLCMMYPRLKLLRDLLADDGAIFVSIDDNEHCNLRGVMDEIFGEENFITTFIWKKKGTVTSTAKNVSIITEYIICYQKSGAVFSKRLLEDAIYSYTDERGTYRRVGIETSDAGQYARETMKFEILGVKPHSGRRWKIGKAKAEELEKNNYLELSNGTVYIKKYEGEEIREAVFNNLIDEQGTSQSARTEVNNEIFGVPETFTTPKPISLIKHLLKMIIGQDDIVLDSFAGSGTTGHAVLDLNKEDGGNRKFILVEMEDNVAKDITAERVKRAIKKYGYKDGFEYCELDKPLFNERGQIEETCDFKQFATYIYFTETQTNIDHAKVKANYIGEQNGTEYYLIYKEPHKNDLDKSFLKKLEKTDSKKIVYADRCTLDESELAEYNVVFKQIPYEVKVY